MTNGVKFSDVVDATEKWAKNDEFWTKRRALKAKQEQREALGS